MMNYWRYKKRSHSKYFYLNRPKNEVDEITYNDIDFLEVLDPFDGTMSSVEVNTVIEH